MTLVEHLNSNLMEINWFIVSIVFIGAIVLVVILIQKNRKDERKIEKEFNYFKKPEEEELNDEKGL
jgi:tetrahydromethanopterin S-methyltransferase subunit E